MGGGLPKLCDFEFVYFEKEAAKRTRRPASADRTSRARNFRRDLEAT